MSETSATSTTSFINTSTECIAKPPISSDSSIDSGFSAMTTSDLITNGPSPASKPPSTSMICNQRRQESARITLSMLPPQPLVPPPPPPPQLQENMYEASSNYDRRASVIPQYYSQPTMTNGMNNLSSYTENYYATYAQSSRPNSNSKSTTLKPPANQTSQLQQSSPIQAHPFQQSLITQRSSTSSLESASSGPLMAMNVKGMLLHGLPSDEVMRNWLSSIKCDEHIENFLYHGYDIHLVTRMTPQDLAAIGCKSPALRKKLLAEIKKLNLEYEIPDHDTSLSLDEWLASLKLGDYCAMLIREGYETIDKVCSLTWEDLEEIGIVKLGHQKRILLAIDRIEKAAKQLDEGQNDNAIYDVHPNHRVSLNGLSENRMGTVGRVRSGFFQTRSGANLDHRGLPIATVMPALKHVNGSIMQADSSSQLQCINTTNDGAKLIGTSATASTNKDSNEQIYDNQMRMETLKLSELTSTMRRNAPPLPPVRTNSLKIIQGNGMPIYDSNYGMENGNIYGTQPTNSTSFLRTPKLGTLTATTNKMLASGGHIQTISASSNRIVPIREAPLPPNQPPRLTYQTNMTQSTIPEKIDEEPAGLVMNRNNDNDFPLPPPNCDGSNASSFINVTGSQLADVSEFPPPPPCEP